VEDGLGETKRVEWGLKVGGVDGVELFECRGGSGGSEAMVMMFACPRGTGSFVE
jgi:hypothetical protein